MGPDVSGVVLQLVHRCIQIDPIAVSEQTVFTQTFRAGTGGDVLHVPFRLHHRIPIGFESQRDERRGVGLGGLVHVVAVLIQFFDLWEILHQFCDELLLLSCGGTVIRDDFHPLTGSDVL